ncbi:MAG: non-canonical purine NTP pyrophosphatase [Campylobacterales bacterium]|nr:non-canonical purine NTP pyrophosphatase [Campylobacterales bacterium]
MKIVVASSNKGKIKEIINLLPEFEILPYSDLMDSFEIEESGVTFKENAIIKANAVYEKLKDKDEYIVIADDSGISIEALDFRPNIYSARFAGINATDKDNLNKACEELKKLNVKSSKAYYTASIAIIYKGNVYTTHGWMHGDVIDRAIGENGFGYDPMFIPDGFDKTLGELEDSVKKDLSHRSIALNLAKIIINNLKC